MVLDICWNIVYRYGFFVYFYRYGSEGIVIVLVYFVLSEKLIKIKSIFFNCGDFFERKFLLMVKVSEGFMVLRLLRFSVVIVYEVKK